MYSHIIVAIDLSHGEAGAALLGKAKDLLDQGGTLRVLSVLEDVPSYIAAELPRDMNDRRQSEARADLAKLIDLDDIKVEVEIRTGAPATQILSCAADTNADLIMIASHRPGLSDYFIGSTAARVVRHAQCSVLVCR